MQLPHVEPSHGPTRALVLGRHDARLTRGERIENGERLVDGDVTSAPTVTAGGVVRLRVRTGTISSLRVFGALDAIAEVRVMRNGQSERAELDLRATESADAPRWNTIVLYAMPNPHA